MKRKEFLKIAASGAIGVSSLGYLSCEKEKEIFFLLKNFLTLISSYNILILALSLSFGIGLYAFPEFVAHIPDFGIKLKLLLTTGLIPAGLLAFILNATLPKK